MKVIVIGCGAGGGTSAQFARKMNRKAEIKIFDKGKNPQYSKCALPFVLCGEIEAHSIIEFSEDWFKKAKIDLQLDTEVFSIDFEGKIVETDKGSEEYDALIIATGAIPYSPIETEGKTYFFRTIEDVEAIKREVKHAKEAVVVGAGLIGLEVAEALKKLGMKVSIVELMPQILPAMIDQDMASLVRKKIEGEVDILLNEGVKEINDGKKMEVVTTNRAIKADFVVIATGNKPNVSLAKKCEVKKAIVVDEKCMTSMPDVYACGDCTQYKNIFGNEVVVGLGNIAVRQGMVAGMNAVGGNEKMPLLLNARTTKIFGLEVAAVGPLQREFPFQPIIGKFKGSTHPDYMKGKEIVVKVMGDEEGRICAAQIIGPGASQRINAFALAIHTGMTFDDFSKTETAYAPPVSPVIDASTIACDIAKRKQK